MKYLRWLDRLHPWAKELTPQESRSLVGDRAFYLSVIAQKGYSTLPGLVVSAQMLSDFWQSQKWQEPLFAELLSSSLSLNVEDPSQLQAIATALRQAIVSAELPPEWVSALAEATASWSVNTLIFRPSLWIPDRLGTGTQARLSELLNTHRVTPNIATPGEYSPEDLALALKRVWAELFRARSILCWQHYGIALSETRLAVLVQPLEDAIASGRLEAHPSRFEIQATPGVGLFQSHTEVIPAIYQVRPQTGEIQIRRLGFPNAAPHLEKSSGDGQGYGFLSEDQFLPDDALPQLLQFAQNLKTDFGLNFQLEWMLRPSTGKNTDALTSASSIYAIQVYPLGVDSMKTPLESTPAVGSTFTATPGESLSPVMMGLAASGGQAIAPACSLTELQNGSRLRVNAYILVAAEVNPDVFPLLKQAAGLVTEQGGLTSHAAILARELGIPAVVGVKRATQQIHSGDWLHLDGDRGVVQLTAIPPHTEPSGVAPQCFSVTVPSLSTQLWVNCSQPSQIDRVAALPVDGVGLIRSELMALEVVGGQPIQEWIQDHGQTQFIDQLTHHLQTMTGAFVPRPVFYRTYDGEVYGSKMDSVLGVRGTLSYQVNPMLFDLELAAIARVRQLGYSNLHVLLPFVRTVEEFRFCRDRIEKLGLTGSASFQLWIVAEVPSVLFLLPEYVQAGVQGIAIGSNDLTQLILGANRDDRTMAMQFDTRHPAVMRGIQQLIETARELGIPCSICGDAPTRYPELIDALVRWGITAISVSPDAVVRTARAIDRAEKRLLVDAARRSLSDTERRFVSEE